IAVYVREAHPTDGASSPQNEKAGISVRQHRTAEERNEVARHCCAALHMTMPVVVDTIDDRVGHSYSGMPDRLYVIDPHGKVSYQGGRGPMGFTPAELEQALVLQLLHDETPGAGPRPKTTATPK